MTCMQHILIFGDSGAEESSIRILPHFVHPIYLFYVRQLQTLAPLSLKQLLLIREGTFRQKKKGSELKKWMPCSHGDRTPPESVPFHTKSRVKRADTDPRIIEGEPATPARLQWVDPCIEWSLGLGLGLGLSFVPKLSCTASSEGEEGWGSDR